MTPIETAAPRISWQDRLRAWWDEAARTGLRRSLGWASLMAVVWWLIPVLILFPADILDPWGVQQKALLPAAELSNPYELFHFVFPRWVAAVMTPFAWLPLEVAVLIQYWLYFVLLALIIHRYGGNTRTVIMVVTSYMAFDLSLQPNIDWIPYIGLVVPVAYSGPFLMTKPQIAFGVWFGYPPRKLIPALGFSIVFLLLTYLIWGAWAGDMLNAIRTTTLRPGYIDHANTAPMDLLPLPISPIIGIVLAIRAHLKRDQVMGIFAWYFLVPYIPFYSLILYYALLSIRFPRLGWIIYSAMWIVYGAVFIYAALVLR